MSAEQPAPWVEVPNAFAAIPEALLYDPDMSSHAVRVYGVLLRHGSDPTNCYPSHARIGRLVGKSSSSVPRWIRELVDAGWVEIVPRYRPEGDPDSNGYRVHAFPIPADRRRAAQQGVPAAQRGGVPAVQRGGSPLHSAPKESHGTKATSNDNPPAPAAPVGGAGTLPGVDPPATKIVTPERERAQRVVAKVWEMKKPKPATPFIAAVKIAERLLEAGHDPQRIGWAMVKAPTITVAAVELQLNAGTAPGGDPRPADERHGIVAHDPARTGGRVKIGGPRP